MTDYRDRVVKALYIPADERQEIGEPRSQSIRDWLKLADIQYLETVNASSTINMRLVIDEDGISRRLPWNPRAHFLCGYPVDHPIVGNALMVSMAMVDLGMDIVDLLPEGIAEVKDATIPERYHSWLTQPTAQGYFHEYRMRFPQPK